MDGERESLMREMFAALANKVDPLTATDGKTYPKAEIQRLLQEWIPTTVLVKRICSLDEGIVVAAPHVSFDNWTEYFANRLAYDLNCGQVLAKNFRDDDSGAIPTSIGRHIHVNRPTESKRKGGVEHETPRAMAAFQKYRSALHEAGRIMPLTFLIELHGHRRHTKLEVATTGISAALAAKLKQTYFELSQVDLRMPEIAIEPLDELRFTAQGTKANGSLAAKICRMALHIEIPRSCRENEDARSRFRPVLSEWLRQSIEILLPS